MAKLKTTKEESLKSVREVLKYLTGRRYKVSQSTLYNHRADGLLREQPGGGFLLKDVDGYAKRNLERPGIDIPGRDLNNDKERLVKARADKLELDIRIKNGQLVPIEDEIRRRVNVITGMKIAMENHRSFFTQKLQEKMQTSAAGVAISSGDDSAEWHKKTLDEMISEAGHLYTDIVLRVFAEIGKQGGVWA